MEYRILGPLEVNVGGRRISVGGPKQRTLLATLLLHANHVVSVERLVDALWEEAPPVTAIAQVQGYVSALRRLLPDRPLLTRPPGYLLQVEAGELDASAFELLAAQGRSALAQGRLDEAAETFRGALGLWRGPVLDDVTGHLVEAEAARLEERRLGLLADRIEVDLALGRHAALVAELTALVAMHPFQEGLRGKLMLALYRAGRQAEALEVYREGRRTLVEELGVEPGPELQDLQEKMLRGDPGLDVGDPTRPFSPEPTGIPVPRPAQLPPDVADFTGRAGQIRQLHDLLARGRDEPEGDAAMVTVAVAGTAGVGKTALAVHVAHGLAGYFPDGQLYVNLRGAERGPPAPGEVLAGFLRALGMEPAAVPADVEERSVLYRSLLAGRRILVVLDNAAGESQVRPLLPASSGCAVLLTSRARLVGLEGAHLVDLDVMDVDRAVELLSVVAGAERVAAEPEAARNLVLRCGCLPLAVRIAGAKLAARPHRTLRWLAHLLGDERRRLDELSAGDLEVRASFGLSYEGLDVLHRRAFRRLGLLSAQDFAAWVVAALVDSSQDRAEELVDGLVAAQLLEFAGRDATGQARYRFHDLLRCYARERADAEDSDTDRAAALERAVGAWLALAEQADAALAHSFFAVPHGTALRWRLDPEESGELISDPLTWFEAERSALVAEVAQATASGLADAAWDMALCLGDFFEVRGYFDDWRHTSDLALAAARTAGSRHAEAAVLRGLGELHTFQDRYDAALSCFRQASDIFAEVGDCHGEAAAASTAGLVCRVRGWHDEAFDWFDKALSVSQQFGSTRVEAYALLGLGTLHLQRGDHDAAGAAFRQGLGISREAAWSDGEAQHLWRLGMLAARQGRRGEADAHLRQARDLWVGNPLGQAHVAQTLAELRAGEGRTAEAAGLLADCLRVYRKLGDRYGEALALHSLGEIHLGESHLGPAMECLVRALGIWRDLGAPAPVARILVTLGDLHAVAGREHAARHAWREALGIFRDLGIPESEDLSARLDLQVAN